MEKEIEIPGATSIDEAVSLLLEEKEKGEKAFCVFNGHILHSETVSVDSAYKEIIGYTKNEYLEELKKRREKYLCVKTYSTKKQIEYEKRAKESRKDNKPITILEVIDGLKFIAENQKLSQDDLFEGLISIGCDFSFDDINRQFPNEGDLIDGMKKGYTSSGAKVILNSRDSEYRRYYTSNLFLNKDDDSSIYHFIRITTGDSNYTKEYVDSLKDGMKL